MQQHVHKIATPILILVVLFIGSFAISHYIDRTGRLLVIEQYDPSSGVLNRKTEIDDLSVLSKLNKIISSTRWDETKGQTGENADYSFYFRYKQQRYEMKPVVYYVYQVGDKVRLMKDTGWSTILTDENAQILMECIQIR